MLAEVLETYTPEERYSMSTFLDGVESYFGSGTRDSISRDSFVYITELVLNEQHLYGSSRLGMIQHADTFRNIYISHIVSIDSPDDEQCLFVYGVDTYYWDSLYTHQRGSKVYEGTNHLGNVLVTFTDKRITECQEDTIYRYVADVKSQTDYSAFHALLHDRQWYSNNDSSNYRFGGINGQEKTDELSGIGNHYTAEYWEMDPRLGRRWNVDPVVKPWESGYAVFANNPIRFIDLKGDDLDLTGVSKGTLLQMRNYLDPNHKLYNPEFLDVMSNLFNDESTVYQYKEIDKPMDGNGNSKIYGNVSYGGKNQVGQDILIIQFTFGISSFFNEQFVLLEETYHAEQFRKGQWGFAKSEDGSTWGSLGLDYYDEAEAKVWAIQSYSGWTSEERNYLNEFGERGLRGVVNRYISGNSAYTGLFPTSLTAEDAVKIQQNLEISIDDLYDEEGRGRIEDAVFRRPEE